MKLALEKCLTEISSGVGPSWEKYPLLGATRAGAAPAKEKIGKHPERYKLVEPGTIFYNPMRIRIGSIGMVDIGGKAGITSPDYVVFKTTEPVLHHRWFYYWLRSSYGANFIRTLARGAVRERLLFRRLKVGEIDAPPWEVQLDFAERLKGIATAKRALVEQLQAVDLLPNALLRDTLKAVTAV